MFGRLHVSAAALAAAACLCAAPAAAQPPSFSCPGGGTEPPRWSVPRVEHHAAGMFSTDVCETTILVTNLGPRPSLVQVDFRSGGEHKCIQEEVAAGESFGFGTNPMLPLWSLGFVGWDGAAKVGAATVLSQQRQLHVAAFLVCRDGPLSDTTPSKVLAMTALPVIDLR